jgi:hypothetical protein
MILKRLKVLADALELEHGPAFPAGTLTNGKVFLAGLGITFSHQGISSGDPGNGIMLRKSAIAVACQRRVGSLWQAGSFFPLGQVEPDAEKKEPGSNGNEKNPFHKSTRFSRPRMKQTPTKPISRNTRRNLGKEGMVFMAIFSKSG